MESLSTSDCMLWDQYSDILDNNPKTILKHLERKDFIEKFYTKCEELLEKYPKFAVSISGGVDSIFYLIIVRHMQN